MSSNNNNNHAHRTTNTLLFGLLLGIASVTTYFGLENKSLQVEMENLNKELNKIHLQAKINVSSSFSGHNFTALEMKETIAPVRGGIPSSDESAISKTIIKMSRELAIETDWHDLHVLNLYNLEYDLDSELDSLKDETEKFLTLTGEYDDIVHAVKGGQPRTTTEEHNSDSTNESNERHKNQLRARGRNLPATGWSGNNREIRIVGQNGNRNFPLGPCEGECDTDEDCTGSLVCFHRDRYELLAVPGCIGGETDKSRTDYCVEGASLVPLLEERIEALPTLEESVEALRMQRRVLSSTNTEMKTLNLLMADSAFGLLKQTNELQDQNKEWDQNQQFLSDQINELEENNGSLTNQFNNLYALSNDLKVQVDDSKKNNDMLNSNILDFQNQNQILEENIEHYKTLNKELGITIIPELNNEINNLSEEISILTNQNQNLKTTSSYINLSVFNLEYKVEDLSQQNDNLEGTVGNLNDNIASLKDSNDEIRTNTVSISDENTNLKDRINRLGKTNEELTNVVSFLEETALDINQPLESVAVFLDEQIHSYRNLLIEQIQNMYEDRITHWDCNYYDWFGDHNFTSNGDIVISEQEDRDDVLEYIDERVLDVLCLDTADFESYLNVLYSDQWTTNGLIDAVKSYTDEAFDYYFPEETDGVGLTKEEWAAANYRCANLNTDQLYPAR